MKHLHLPILLLTQKYNAQTALWCRQCENKTTHEALSIETICTKTSCEDKCEHVEKCP